MSPPFGVRSSDPLAVLGVGQFPGRVASIISVSLGGTQRNVLFISVSLYHQPILYVDRRLVPLPQKGSQQLSHKEFCQGRCIPTRHHCSLQLETGFNGCIVCVISLSP